VAAELTIGEVAARSGVAPSALRFYERQGLIDSNRTDGNQRRYARNVLRRIAFIQAGRAAGVTLADINTTLARLPTGRTPSRKDWERLSNKWRDDLDARIAMLQALRDRLTTCIGCGCLSIDKCDLLNPDDEAAEQGAGAHYLRKDGPRGDERQRDRVLQRQQMPLGHRGLEGATTPHDARAPKRQRRV
jgi:MerR family redox-sensitive transcriptional activator SoxR